MSDTVIKVENLSKSYTIRHQSNERYDALRDVLANGAKSLGSRLLRTANSHQPPATSEEFWALNDVSFEVKQGERVGIIGRNGAGKSTLLKILSRITEPTKGRIHIKGRVASLLEVGTGFHPELTGRENIYLNGAILGMSREEIRRKFDEIVAFAEVDKFLDTPVKRYSSGMYVRLAFAVAAHLEPEILVVDEVLAVGDIAFQQKCLGKMSEVADHGRTVLFVSHNLGAIWSLCPSALWVKDGKIAAYGNSNDIVAQYRKSIENQDGKILVHDLLKRGPALVEIVEFYLEDINGVRCESVNCGASAQIIFRYQTVLDKAKADVYITAVIIDLQGYRLFSISNRTTGQQLTILPPHGQFVCSCPTLPLLPGEYDVLFSCHVGNELIQKVQLVGAIIVTEGNFPGLQQLPQESLGRVLISHKWMQR